MAETVTRQLREPFVEAAGLGITNEGLRLLFIVGFLGSLTTFSTFAFDNYNLLNLRSYYYLFTNLILSNFIGIIMVFIGTRTIRLFS